jgi:prepilin-type N-terminal cleavage/methylation domain-containing protein
MGKIKKRKGFTLVEEIIAVAITAIVVTAVYNAWQYLDISYKNQKENASVQMDAQNAINTIVAELKRGDKGSTSNISIVPGSGTDTDKIEISDGTDKWIYKGKGNSSGYNEMSLIMYKESAGEGTATTVAAHISDFNVSQDLTTKMIRVKITVKIKQKDGNGADVPVTNKTYEGQYKPRTGIIN